MTKQAEKKATEQLNEYEIISGSYTARVEKEDDNGKKYTERTRFAVGERVKLTEKQAKNLTNIVRRVDAAPVAPVEFQGVTPPKSEAVLNAEKIVEQNSKKDATVTPQENAEVTGTAGTGSLDVDHNGDGGEVSDEPQTTTGKKLEEKGVEQKGGSEGAKTTTTTTAPGKPAEGAKK